MSDDNELSAMVSQQGDAIYAAIWYPRSRPIKAVQVGLVDVRAADDIRIEYDFDRDGWVIKQDKQAGNEDVIEPEWVEVAFVQAWGLEPK